MNDNYSQTANVSDPLAQVSASLGSAIDALRAMSAEMRRHEEEEANRLRELSMLHGIRIVENPALQPNEIMFQVGSGLWEILKLKP